MMTKLMVNTMVRPATDVQLVEAVRLFHFAQIDNARQHN